MADTKISGMAAATALTGAEVLPVVQSAANVKATTQQVVDAAMTTGLTRQALGSINTNTTIDWSLGSYATATITGALTFTFSNPAASGKACVAYLQLTNGGSQVITWPGSVTWSGGTAPTLRSSGVDLLRFYTQDGGTAWFGTAEQDEAVAPAGSGSELQYRASATEFGATSLHREDANTIAQRNGANAQTLVICGSYTDASNYEGVWISYTSGAFEVAPRAAGTGVRRNLRLLKYNDGVKGYIEVVPSDYAVTIKAFYGAGNAASGVLFNEAPGFNGTASSGNNYTAIGKNGIFFGAREGNISVSQSAKTGYDDPAATWTFTAQPAYASASTNIVGGSMYFIGGAGASASAGAANGGGIYLDGGRGYGTGSHGDVIVGATRGVLRLPVKTVATLPAATVAGRRCFVSDANATTFHSIVAGGGANFVPVFSDGTDWRIG